MRKVFNYSPKKVQAISPQIEKERAKQPLETENCEIAALKIRNCKLRDR